MPKIGTSVLVILRMLNNPVLEAERRLKQSKMGVEQEQFDTGKAQELIEAKRKFDLQDAATKMTTGQLTDVTNRGLAVQKAYANFEMDEDKNPLSRGRNEEYYTNQFLPLMKQMGGGNKYPPTWGPEAKAAIEKANKSAIDTVPHLQEMAKAKQSQDAALKLHAQTDESAERRATTMSGARTALAEDKLPELAQIKNKIEKEKGYDTSDVRRLQALYDTEKGPKQKDALQGQKDKWERDFYTSSPEQQRVMAKEVGLPATAKPTDYSDAKFKKTEKALRDDWVESQLSPYSPKTTAAAKAVAPSASTPTPKIGQTKVVDGKTMVYVPKTGATPPPAVAPAAVPQAAPMTPAGVSPDALKARQSNAGGILEQVMKSIMPGQM